MNAAGLLLRQQLKCLDHCAHWDDGWLTMKHLLITTIAAVLLVGCGNSQQSAPPQETKPEPQTAKVPDIPIHEAAGDGNIEAVKQHLAAGTDVDEITLEQTPLLTATYYGYKEIAELLIANGADVNFRSQFLVGTTPLHAAASEGYKDIVKLLIANGANVNAKESLPSRRTPLYGAIQDGHKEIVQMLITNGADINVNANSENGPSPLEWAISFEQSEIANILRRRGAKSRL